MYITDSNAEDTREESIDTTADDSLGSNTESNYTIRKNQWNSNSKNISETKPTKTMASINMGKDNCILNCILNCTQQRQNLQIRTSYRAEIKSNRKNLSFLQTA